MKKLAIALAFVICCFAGVQAQPRIVEKTYEKTPPPALANVSYKAKYEGGMFGFSRKEEGTLKFDDAGFRVVFYDKNNKERFGIPYKDLSVIYPQSQSVQSTTGKVVQNAPLPGAGIAGMFMKDKKRYMIVNFDDVEMNVKGTVNFKFESLEILDKAIHTLGDKAEMQQRGDAYYRKKAAATTAKDSN